MIRSTQTWGLSERGAVAGLRLLIIGIVLLSVAAIAIVKSNPDKKSDTSRTTTSTTTTSTTTTPTTTEKPVSITDLKLLKCDNTKFALVADVPPQPFGDAQQIDEPSYRKKAAAERMQLLIVNSQLCDSVKENKNSTETNLFFIGPFEDIPTACAFKDSIEQGSSPSSATSPATRSGNGGPTSSVTSQPLTDPGWKVKNIRELTGNSESCAGQ